MCAALSIRVLCMLCAAQLLQSRMQSLYASTCIHATVGVDCHLLSHGKQLRPSLVSTCCSCIPQPLTGVQIFAMMPWSLAQYKYTAQQITKAVGDAAGEAARAQMKGLGSVDDAVPLLKGVVNLAASECSRPLAPAVRSCSSTTFFFCVQSRIKCPCVSQCLHKRSHCEMCADSQAHAISATTSSLRMLLAMCDV
jgi:hypothetical protein